MKTKPEPLNKIEYYNLTQAIGTRVCYFRSTDLEQGNWKRLLWSFPDEMLYLMSKGKEIIIVDKSKKIRGKIERIFVPVMNDLLNGIYFSSNSQNKQLNHHLIIAKQELKDINLLTKFKYWKKFIPKVNLKAKTVQVPREWALR